MTTGFSFQRPQHHDAAEALAEAGDPAQRRDHGDDGGDDCGPAEAIGVQEVLRVHQPVAAVDFQQARGTFRDAGDDPVQQDRLAAEHQPGDGESGGQQAGDGEEHVEPDAGAHQRAVLEVVVLPRTHGPEGVQPGEQPLEQGRGLGHGPGA